jgi:hypothetical protein
VTRSWAASTAALLIAACGCAGSADLMDIGICALERARFSIDIDNPFFPLPVGHRIVLEGEEAGSALLVRITVLDETETVADVQTRVVEEYEARGGRVLEISRNFYAQADDGTVCYFGEDVDIYDEAGNVVSHEGAWRADGERIHPGIFMPAKPRVGQAFQQEIAPGIAEDEAEIIATGERTEVPAGVYDATLTVVDTNPLDGSQGTKIYARGIGLIVDGPARMTRSPSAGV